MKETTAGILRVLTKQNLMSFVEHFGIAQNCFPAVLTTSIHWSDILFNVSNSTVWMNSDIH